jgi:hypothetical protein
VSVRCALASALILATPAAAQSSPSAELLTPGDILDVLPGVWEIDPAELAKGVETTQRCEDDPQIIRFAPGVDDGAVLYESWFEDDPTRIRRSTVRAEGDAIHIRYEGEERLTPDGDPVEWLLFMPDRDHFFWVRTDWIEDNPGGRTGMRRRCPGGAIS